MEGSAGAGRDGGGRRRVVLGSVMLRDGGRGWGGMSVFRSGVRWEVRVGTREAGEDAGPEALRRWPGMGSSAEWRIFNGRSTVCHSHRSKQRTGHRWRRMSRWGGEGCDSVLFCFFFFFCFSIKYFFNIKTILSSQATKPDE